MEVSPQTMVSRGGAFREDAAEGRRGTHDDYKNWLAHPTNVTPFLSRFRYW